MQLKKFRFSQALWIAVFVIIGLIISVRSEAFGFNITLPNQEWNRFVEAYQLIKRYYVRPVDDQTLVDNAIRGMLSGLDNYSTYLDATDLGTLEQITSGQVTGIGVEVISADNVLKVITPLDNSPAQKAGILPNDEIIEINNAPVATMSFHDAITAMRGAVGTQVEITVMHPNASSPVKLTLTRALIKTQNITSKLLTKDYGYIRVAIFQNNAATQIENAINQLDQENQAPLHGLVLDLRNNPGGLLDASADAADVFLDSKTLTTNNQIIVYSKNRLGNMVFSAKATPGDALHDAPMVVLVNGGSASGAEIVAGALQDYHRAVLVGTKTFGKGSVQTVIPLDDNTAVKLTTALYYTPTGRLIDHVGIQPDIVIEQPTNSTKDVQLERALQILKKM